MVYRSLGLECTQEELWQKVSRPGYRGSRRAQTYRLAADALERGFTALVLQARQPWALLQQGMAAEARLILNHNIKNAAGQFSGHYSVLVGINDESAILHDPQTGPEQTLSRDDLLKAWESQRFRSEVTGRVLVAIAPAAEPTRACALCAAAIPEAMRCRACAKSFPLHPARVLGCVAADCAARLWDYLYCPFCDMRRASVDETPE
jgi:hypothetical protein